MENTILETTNIFSEVSEIFKYLDKDILEKIPQKLRNEINNNKNPNYDFVYDKTKELNEQKINEKTKDMISALYIMYCCDENTKNDIMKICEQNEEKYKKEIAEKYSYESLFKNKRKTANVQENIQTMDLVVKKEDTIFSRIIRKIKSWFSRR